MFLRFMRRVDAPWGFFKNDKGEWLLGFECRSFSLLVFSVELHALLIGLRLAWDYGYRQLIVVSDCTQGVMCVASRIVDIRPEVHASVAEIKELLCRACMSCGVFTSPLRSCNTC